jgi:putative exosortase-associated protein (TIGR04073 family)
MFHARWDISAGGVQAGGEVGAFALFLRRCGGGSERLWPTRKLGRGLSNFFLGPAEVFVTVTTVNTYDGNAAAAGYGVVRGVGRSATRHIAGFLEIVLWPFPHGAKVTIHYSRVIFLGFTPAIQNFRPSSATNRNIPTCAIIRKDRRACLS